MADRDVVPPPQLVDLPRDARGFIVPAEADWDDDGPHVKEIGQDNAMALAFARACAVCGYRLVLDQPVWRVFTQGEAAYRRQERQVSRETTNPGHLVCMLYAAQVCPFLRSSGARLGKDSTTSPGARRGTLPALLGYEDYQLLLPENRPIDRPEFLYRRLVGDVRYRKAEDLAERYTDELTTATVPAGPRSYWTNTDQDVAAMQKVLKGGQRVVQGRSPADRVLSGGVPFAAFDLPVI